MGYATRCNLALSVSGLRDQAFVRCSDGSMDKNKREADLVGSALESRTTGVIPVILLVLLSE